MATVYPSSVRPALPREEQCRYLVPVTSAVMGAMAEATAYLVGWRARRAAHCVVTHDASDPPATSDPYGKGYGTVRVAWRSAGHCEHVAVVVGYQAGTQGGTIALRLEKLDGTSLDPSGAGNAVLWSSAAGDLEVAEEDADDESRYRRLVATTGEAVDDAPAATPTGPRALTMPAAGRGEWVQLLVVPSNTRLLDVQVFELFEPEVEQ